MHDLWLGTREMNGWLAARVPIPHSLLASLSDKARALAFWIPECEDLHLITLAHGAGIEAHSSGKTIKSFRREILEAVGGGFEWAAIEDAISHFVSCAYHVAGYRIQMEAAEFSPWWRYRTVGDALVRAGHARHDGAIYRYDDPWWQTNYPLNGWGCRCYAETLSDRQAKPLLEKQRHDRSNAAEPGFRHNAALSPQAGEIRELADAMRKAGLPAFEAGRFGTIQTQHG
jgi:hypothetical protein